MLFNQGNMLSITPCNSKSLLVGNGVLLPVSHNGQTYYPFSQTKFILNDVLVSNKIVKNLVFVRKFTTNNSIFITFDPFVFSVMDLDSGTLLQRCDTTGDLYAITHSS